MNEKLILMAVAACIYLVILISIPFRRRKVSEQAGKLVMPLRVVSSRRWIMIAIFAALLIGLVPLRLEALGLFVSVVLQACALIGMELAARDAVVQKQAGIYEHMLIASTHTILWSDILGLPTLSYEDDEETTMVDKRVLQLVTQDGSNIDIIFYDEKERQAAVEKILEVAPELKPAE